MIFFSSEIQEPQEEYKVVIANTFRSVVYDAILLLSSELPTATKTVPKSVEQTAKISYNAFNKKEVIYI
jgi:hypothetical protein